MRKDETNVIVDIRHDKLKKLGIESDKDAISKLKDLVYYLKTHNKNYTKDQYYKVLEIEEILELL